MRGEIAKLCFNVIARSPCDEAIHSCLCMDCFANARNDDRVGCLKIISAVIVREGGRSSTPEQMLRNREAAAYWIPAFAGMTASAWSSAVRPAFAGDDDETLRGHDFRKSHPLTPLFG